jgi:hypothetical protein
MTSKPAAYVLHQTDDLNVFNLQISQQQEVFPKVARFKVLGLESFRVCFRLRPHKLCLSVAQWPA